jgi:Uma2 family endonuclease
MEPIALPTGSDWLPPPTSIHRVTVDQYEAMVASGAFTKRDRLHLINGILVKKMTEHPPHTVTSIQLDEALRKVTPGGWHPRAAKPLRIPDRKSEPEPDLALARGRARDYLKQHPGPADVALVVEVSDSSLSEDRGVMVEVYGGGGVPVYWIVNLVDRQVEVYTDPRPGGYGLCRVYKPGEAVPVIIDAREVGAIAVDDILP